MNPLCVCCARKPARFRGTCAACYLRHLTAVNAGETTWAALEALGQSAPARPRSLGKARFDRKERP